ncbi:hypothetical protein [Thalassolituus sp.]|uniref:hypothetical protein n=1 Tax=Thalassolituus sp. TaxID=2030822 RepID=UPI003517D699
MRLILNIAILFFMASHEPQSEVDMTQVIADAESAAITNPYHVSIEDNYGNPDDFVKYIIRKPPAIA